MSFQEGEFIVVFEKISDPKFSVLYNSELKYAKAVTRKFTVKHLCWCLFFNKVVGLRSANFSVNFVKFLKTPIL